MRKILVLGTGGTISCAASEDGLKPAVSVAELVKNVWVPDKYQVEIQTEQLFELDSTNMTPRHWEAIAKRIHERYDEFDGFVLWRMRQVRLLALFRIHGNRSCLREAWCLCLRNIRVCREILTKR